MLPALWKVEGLSLAEASKGRNPLGKYNFNDNLK